MKNEWVRTLRTAAQALLALIPVAPVLVNALGLGETSAIGGGVVAAAAGAPPSIGLSAAEAPVVRVPQDPRQKTPPNKPPPPPGGAPFFHLHLPALLESARFGS